MTAPRIARGADFAARFWARVLKTDGCWLWQGSRGKKGYGRLSRGNKTVLAHRISWQLHNGPIPGGLCALHACDNRVCVRPDHLFLGTIADNNVDMVTKGRRASFAGESNPSAKLTREQAEEIRLDTRSFSAFGSAYGVSKGAVQHIKQGHTWTP